MSIDLNKTIATMRILFDMNSELWHQLKAIEQKSPLGKDDPEAIKIHGEIVSLNKIYIQYLTEATQAASPKQKIFLTNY